MNYIYGRFYYKSEKVKLYAIFNSWELAEEYNQVKGLDITLDSVDFVFNTDTEELLFKDEEKSNKWNTLQKVRVYDARKDECFYLNDLFIDYEKLIENIKENMK